MSRNLIRQPHLPHFFLNIAQNVFELRGNKPVNQGKICLVPNIHKYEGKLPWPELTLFVDLKKESRSNFDLFYDINNWNSSVFLDTLSVVGMSEKFRLMTTTA